MSADRMRPQDFGLSPGLDFFRTKDAAQGTPVITQTTIYKCTNFSVSGALHCVEIASTLASWLCPEAFS
jgi:hypothetical protein